MPESNPVGRRLRRTTISTPTAMSTTARNRNSTTRVLLVGSGPGPGRLDHGTDGLLGRGPVRTVGPVLPLPDRCALLERVDAPPGRLEGVGPVRRRYDDGDRRLREGQRAGPVEQRQPFDLGPPTAGLGRHLAEHPGRLFVVRLVVQPDDPGAPFGVVADDAEEAD